jgi:hypothetical protein
MIYSMVLLYLQSNYKINLVFDISFKKSSPIHDIENNHINIMQFKLEKQFKQYTTPILQT